MTILAYVIKQCPNCDCEIKTWGYASRSFTGSGKFYTDGFQEWSVFNENSAVLICPGCNDYIWQGTLPKKKFLSMLDPEFSRCSLPESRPVQLSDYEDILHRTLWKTQAQEKEIRIRLWWTFNNAYRDNDDKSAKVLRDQEVMYEDILQRGSKWMKTKEMRGDLIELGRIKALLSFNYSDCYYPTKKFNLPPDQEANLRRLLELLDTNNPTESIMKAEILREIGQFDQCLKQLNQSSNEAYMSIIKVIRKLAKCKTRRVKRYK